MTALDEQSPTPEGVATPSIPSADPFKNHLIALLSIYELAPFPGGPIPKYEGPSDWQTETILRSLSAVARRMLAAEAVATEYKQARSQLVRSRFIFIFNFANFLVH
jgi:hypothetical protein